MDESLALLWNSFPALYGSWVQKCKNESFEENKGFWCSFLKLKYRWLQTGQANLKQHQTFLNFA